MRYSNQISSKEDHHQIPEINKTEHGHGRSQIGGQEHFIGTLAAGRGGAEAAGGAISRKASAVSRAKRYVGCNFLDVEDLDQGGKDKGSGDRGR